MNMRKRPRKLTRKEKIIANNAGFVPQEWMLAGSDERYLLLVNKLTGAHGYAEIAPRKRRTVSVSVIETGRNL